MSFGQGGGGWGQQPPMQPGYPQQPQGEAPLPHIPFTPDDVKNLRQTSFLARAAGIAAVVSTVLQMGVGIVAGFRVGDNHMGRNGFAIVIAAILAGFLWQASKAIDAMVDTDGADQHHLGKALGALRNYFLVKGVLYIVAAAALCCLCGLGGMLGAIFFVLSAP